MQYIYFCNDLLNLISVSKLKRYLQTSSDAVQISPLSYIFFKFFGFSAERN